MQFIEPNITDTQLIEPEFGGLAISTFTID
jgi:hypothetical protein